MHEDLTPIDWAIRPLKKYAVFSGRAPRAEYWWFYLATTIVSFVLNALEKGFDLSEVATGDAGFLSGIFSLAIIVPWIAVTVRRLHDTGRSGWWLLVPLIAFAVMGFFVALDGFGLSGKSAESFTGIVIGGLGFLLAVITFLVFMVLPGTDGTNRYGADPYGPDHLEEVFA